VQNIKQLKELLVTVSGGDFEIKALNGNQVKVLPKTVDKYRTIIDALIENTLSSIHTSSKKTDFFEQSSGVCITPQMKKTLSQQLNVMDIR